MGAATPLRFSSFEFEPGQMVLSRAGTILPIGRRQAAILRALLERPGQVVGTEELTAAGWPGLLVENSNLSVQIAQLRKRIGAERIQTIERVGYRFADAVEAADRAAAAVPSRPAIALRRFACIGGAPRLAVLAEALAEELAAGLASFSSLGVVTAGTAEFAYALDGSVRAAGTGAHATVRLVDRTSGAIVFAATFETAARPLARAVAELVPRLAAAIDSEVQTLSIERARRSRPDGDAADDLYQRAQRLLRSSEPADNAACTALYERAVAMQPENVRYLAGACEAMQHRVAMGWPPLTADDAQRCHGYALRGLALASDDAASMALFGISLLITGDPDLGHATAQRASSLNPNDVLASLVAGQANMHWGNLAAAEAQLRHAYWLNPRDHNQRFVLGTLARIELMHGRMEAAGRMAQQALAVNQHFNPIHWVLISSAVHLRRNELAERYLARFRRSYPGVTLAQILRGQPMRNNRNVGMLDGLQSAGFS